MAASVEMDEAVLIKFAQKLAGNEKKFRDRAVKKLRKWMETRSQSTKGGFSEEDMLKIWKGLHYCMWMCDKPLVQEDLCDKLSKITHTFSNIDQSFLYIDVFFKTEAREWFGIDRLRLDKYMMLVRRVLRESFELVKKHGWQNAHIAKLTYILESGLANPTADHIPDGLKYHMADIYMEELEMIGGQELEVDQVHKFLEPYINMLAKVRSGQLAHHLMQRIFLHLIDYAMELASLQEQMEEDDEEEEEEEEEAGQKKFDMENLTIMNVDYEKLADQLFELASSTTCFGKNRKRLYSLVKTYRDLAQGILPSANDEDSGSEDSLDERDVEQAIKRLSRFESQMAGDHGKNNKKRKKEKLRAEGEEPPKKKQKKKKAKKNLANGISEETPDEKLDISGESQLKKKDKKIKKSEKVSKESVQSKKEDSVGSDNDSNEAKRLAKKTEKKSKKEKTLHTAVRFPEISSDINKEDISKSKKLSNKRKKKGQSSEETDENEMGKSTKNISSKEVTPDKQNNNKVKEKVKKRKSLSGSLVDVDDKTFLSSDITEKLKSPESKEKKKKKRKSLSAPVVSEENVQNGEESAKKKSPKGSAKKKTAKQSAEPPHEDGDVEIWIPNKKYKGNENGEAKSVKEEGFASFTSAKSPPAFVKKALLKVTPKSEPRKAMKKFLDEAPGSAPGSGKKRVSFIMSRNQELSHQESLAQMKTQSPVSLVKANQGILKSPASSASNSPVQKTPTGKLFKTKRARASDFF